MSGQWHSPYSPNAYPAPVEYSPYGRQPAWPAVDPLESTPRPLAGRRWCAKLVDWTIMITLSAPLWIFAAHYLHTQALEAAYRFGEKSLPSLVFAGWSGLDDDLASAAGDLWSTVVWTVMVTLAGQLALMALYDVLCHMFLGRTIGKILLGLAVFSRDRFTGELGLRRGLTFRAAVVRTMVSVLLPGLAWLALINAIITLSVLPGLLGLVLLAVSVVESASLRRTALGQMCGHDRLAGTVVVPASSRQYLNTVENAAYHTVGALQAAWHSDPVRRIAATAQGFSDRFTGRSTDWQQWYAHQQHGAGGQGYPVTQQEAVPYPQVPPLPPTQGPGWPEPR